MYLLIIMIKSVKHASITVTCFLAFAIIGINAAEQIRSAVTYFVSIGIIIIHAFLKKKELCILLLPLSYLCFILFSAFLI